MGYRMNDAFSGKHEIAENVTIDVRYLDGGGVREVFGYKPPGHPGRKKIGWYWSHAFASSGVHGPHTSSRMAFQAAQKFYGQHKGG
jgi:hypothetical protein